MRGSSGSGAPAPVRRARELSYDLPERIGLNRTLSASVYYDASGFDALTVLSNEMEETTMRRPDRILTISLAGLLGTFLSCGLLAAEPPAHAYVGVEKCKICHNSPAKGAQFAKWSDTAHAKAFSALASDEAKKLALAKGISDPQKAPACLRCHVTGAGAPADKLIDKYKAEDGVGCESCHGPGGDYWKMDVMKDPAKAQAAGLLVPSEKTCSGCHNPESPTFKGFDAKASLGKIAHPNPQKVAHK